MDRQLEQKDNTRRTDHESEKKAVSDEWTTWQLPSTKSLPLITDLLVFKCHSMMQ